MDLPPQQSNVNCTYCKKSVPVANIDLHAAHCFRTRERRKHGNKMIPGAEESRRNINGADNSLDASGDSETQESSRKGVLSTVAVTGVILLLGSWFFKREGHNQHLR